jgi:repressor LexA
VLTQRQLQLLQFIYEYASEHGVCPSFEEMRCALKLRSKSGIHRLISALEERGYIRRMPHRARALDIVRTPSPPLARRSAPDVATAEAAGAGPDGSNVVWGPFARDRRRPVLAGSSGREALPVYGRIAAGTPIEALADGSETVDVPQMMVGDGQHYVLEVIGNSMIDAGIFDGDFVVIKQCDHADSGEIVVALIEDREVTMKRLRKRGASIALEAANPSFETRIFGPHQVKVQGKLVGLLRRY